MSPTHPAFRRRARSRTRFVLSLGGLLACLLFALLGIFAARPFMLASKLRAENDGIEREMYAYRMQNQKMEKQARALSTEAGLERAARQLGYVRPGEQRLRIPGKL